MSKQKWQHKGNYDTRAKLKTPIKKQKGGNVTLSRLAGQLGEGECLAKISDFWGFAGNNRVKGDAAVTATHCDKLRFVSISRIGGQHEHEPGNFGSRSPNSYLLLNDHTCLSG